MKARHGSNDILLFQIIKAIKIFFLWDEMFPCGRVLPLIQVEELLHLCDPVPLANASLLLLLTNPTEPHTVLQAINPSADVASCFSEISQSSWVDSGAFLCLTGAKLLLINC